MDIFLEIQEMKPELQRVEAMNESAAPQRRKFFSSSRRNKGSFWPISRHPSASSPRPNKSWEISGSDFQTEKHWKIQLELRGAFRTRTFCHSRSSCYLCFRSFDELPAEHQSTGTITHSLIKYDLCHYNSAAHF